MRKLWTLMSSRRARGIFAVVVLAAAAIGAVNVDQRTLRQRTQDWAAKHTPSTMTLEELAAYPVAYQPVVFDALPPAEQSRLWRVKFQRLLDTEKDLTSEQRAFIVQVSDLATPASFEKDAVKPAVCEDVARLFPEKTQRERVRKVAVGIAPSRSLAAVWLNSYERVRSTVLLGAQKGDGMTCNCSGSISSIVCDCGIGWCNGGPCEQGGQCGCIWHEECTLLCSGSILSLKTPPTTTSK